MTVLGIARDLFRIGTRVRRRAVVVGCGHMGGYHVRAVERLGIDVATVDPDPGTGAAHATLAAAPPAEFAIIAAPVPHLAQQARAALRAGMHVLVEKPFAADVAEGRELCDLAGQRGLTLAVGYTERANPAVRALRDHLHLAGAISGVTIHREGPPPRSPRDVIADLAVHDIDVLRFLGFEPSLQSIVPGPMRATLELDLGGPPASVTVDSSVSDKRRTLTIHGSSATLALDYQRRTLARLTPAGAELVAVEQNVSALDQQLAAFLAHRPLATGEDGLAVLEVLGGECGRLDSGDDLSVEESA